MKVSLPILILALSLSGCGEKVDNNSRQSTLAAVEAQMNSRKFEEAIPTLERLKVRYPKDDEIKIKLLHAYAGAGSFEALKVVEIWKEFEVNIDLFESNIKKDSGLSLKDFLPKLASEIENLLRPIPNLTKKQKRRLDQAIALYQELGFKIETAGRYNNFKWGTLHIYRLAIGIKELVQDVKVTAQEGNEIDLKAIEKAIIPRLSIIGKDIFMAYQLFGNSFDKVRKISASIDKIIAKTINNDSFKLQVNTLARTELEFYESLLRDNIAAASVLVRKLVEVYRDEGYGEQIGVVVNNTLPTAEDLNQAQRRIEALLKVTLTNFLTNNPELEQRLKSIFNEELKKSVISAAKQSLEVKNTEPLKNLLASRRPDLDILRNYYLLLKGEVQASDLEANINAELEILRRKIDLELLKDELKIIANSLDSDTLIIQLGAAAITYRTKELLQDRKKVIEREIEQLRNYLSPLVEDLRDSTQAPNHDQGKMNRIIQETIDFVES